VDVNGGQGTKCCRKIAENYNRLSRVHKRYRRQMTDGRATATECSFWATVYKTVRPMLSDHCLSCLSVTLVQWIKIKLCMQVGLGPGHIVLDGDPAPPPQKGGTAPNFQPISVASKYIWFREYIFRLWRGCYSSP